MNKDLKEFFVSMKLAGKAVIILIFMAFAAILNLAGARMLNISRGEHDPSGIIASLIMLLIGIPLFVICYFLLERLEKK